MESATAAMVRQMFERSHDAPLVLPEGAGAGVWELETLAGGVASEEDEELEGPEGVVTEPEAESETDVLTLTEVRGRGDESMMVVCDPEGTGVDETDPDTLAEERLLEVTDGPVWAALDGNEAVDAEPVEDPAAAILNVGLSFPESPNTVKIIPSR